MLKHSAAAFCVMALTGGTAFGVESMPPLPHNTIRCEDWTHNPDGSWTAHPDARPFDIGSVTGLTVQSTTVHPHDMNMGSVDLWTALNGKCGKAR